jgi:hypothetical protein
MRKKLFQGGGVFFNPTTLSFGGGFLQQKQYFFHNV